MRTKRLVTATALLLLASTTPALTAETDTTTSETDTQSFETMFGQGPQEEDVYRTDRLLLTATGSLKPVHLAPSVATVITAEDIDRMGATTLDEVLETVPGLHVAPSPKNQMNAVYSIRGIHTSLNPQVLVMIDGVSTQYAYSGGRPFGFRLPVTMVSRIEVVRGPGSALHGADAFAGTINIITKDGKEIAGTRTGIRYGSFDSTDVWLQHGNEYKGWDVTMSLDYMKSQGDDARVIDTDLQSMLDSVFGTSATLAPGALNTEYKILNGHFSLAKENWTFHFQGWKMEDSAMADGVTQTLAPQSRLDSDLYLTDLNYHNDSLLQDTTLDSKIYYKYLKNDPLFQLLPPGTTVPIGTDGNIDFVNPAGITNFPDGVIGRAPLSEKQLGIEQILLYEGLNQHQLRFVLGYRYIEASPSEEKNFGPGVLDGSQAVSGGTLTNVSGTPNIYMDDETRHLSYAAIQDGWFFLPKWELTAGARYDSYSDFGDTVNPRVALVWETRYDLTSKLMYGRAFRAPGFAELYAKNNPSNLGNPNLDPETIDTYEMAFDYQPLNRLRTIFSVFYYEINDLIELVQDPDQTTLTAQNSRNQQGQGGEIEVIWDVTDHLKIKGNYALQRAKDMDTKVLVADAPEMQAYLNANWQFMPDWSIDSQYYWIGGRHRAEGDTRQDIDDYNLVNLTLRKKNVIKQWDAALAVRNLFDEDIREPSSATITNDYPMPSRSIWAELEYHF